MIPGLYHSMLHRLFILHSWHNLEGDTHVPLWGCPRNPLSNFQCACELPGHLVHRQILSQQLQVGAEVPHL